MSTDYVSQAEFDALAGVVTNGLKEINEAAKASADRRPSKAHLLGSIDFNQSWASGSFTTGGPSFFAAVAKARSRDHDEQAIGKAELQEMGSRWANLSPAAKATLGTTDAGGGYIIPNNLVAGVVEQAVASNPFRRILTVVNGVRGSAVDIPLEALAPTRATVQTWGATKSNTDVTMANYTATLYTLAHILDVSNQLLRHSAGAAEQLLRSSLSRRLGLGEAYYVLNGSGSSEPKGIITSIDAASNDLTTSHTASDSTVAGSVRAAVATAIEALALRNFEADAIVMNSADAAHAYVQGSDTGGFWTSETGGTTLFGLPIVTTTAIASGTALVGQFRAATLFIGDDYRVDVSSEAGDRFDKNLTGFRAEEEIGFNADPPVLAGAIQKIEGLVP